MSCALVEEECVLVETLVVDESYQVVLLDIDPLFFVELVDVHFCDSVAESAHQIGSEQTLSVLDVADI